MEDGVATTHACKKDFFRLRLRMTDSGCFYTNNRQGSMTEGGQSST